MEPIFSGPGLVEPIFFKILWALVFDPTLSLTSISMDHLGDLNYLVKSKLNKTETFIIWLNLFGSIGKIEPLSQKDSSFLELPKIEPSSAFKDMWLASQILSQA